MSSPFRLQELDHELDTLKKQVSDLYPCLFQIVRVLARLVNGRPVGYLICLFFFVYDFYMFTRHASDHAFATILEGSGE